uniref:Uncharacterized protein n=1 Tax=Parascaris univalens TaxID=6257 RepID=A0A914ZN73_PARUN
MLINEKTKRNVHFQLLNHLLLSTAIIVEAILAILNIQNFKYHFTPHLFKLLMLNNRDRKVENSNKK